MKICEFKLQELKEELNEEPNEELKGEPKGEPNEELKGEPKRRMQMIISSFELTVFVLLFSKSIFEDHCDNPFATGNRQPAKS